MYIVVIYDGHDVGRYVTDVIDHLYYTRGSLHLRNCYCATVLDYRVPELCSGVVYDSLINAPYDYMSGQRYGSFGSLYGHYYKPLDFYLFKGLRSCGGGSLRVRSAYVFTNAHFSRRSYIYPYSTVFYDSDQCFLWSFNVGLIVFSHLGLYYVNYGIRSIWGLLLDFCRVLAHAFDIFMGSDLYISFERVSKKKKIRCGCLYTLWHLYGVGEGVVLGGRSTRTRGFVPEGDKRKKVGRFMSFSRVSCKGLHVGDDKIRKVHVYQTMKFYVLDRALFKYFDEGGREVSDANIRDFCCRHGNIIKEVVTYMLLSCSPMSIYAGSYDSRYRSLYRETEGVRVSVNPVLSGFYPDDVGFSSFYDILSYWVIPYSSSLYFGFSRRGSSFMIAGVLAAVAAMPLFLKRMVSIGRVKPSRLYDKVISLSSYAFHMRSVAVYIYFNRRARKNGRYNYLDLGNGVVYFPFGSYYKFKTIFLFMRYSNFMNHHLIKDPYYLNFMSDLAYLFTDFYRNGHFNASWFYYYMMQVRSLYCGGQVVYGNEEKGNLVKGYHFSFSFSYPVLKERNSVYISPFLIKFAPCLIFYINAIVGL